MLSRAVCFAALVIVAACNPSHETDSGVGAPEPGPLGKAFQASAARANVPRDLLVAIAQVEGGLAVPAHRTVETDATVPAAGPLMLRRGRLDTLRRAAELSGETELALREQGDVALAAGAQVLASLPHDNDLASWERALEEMSGYSDAEHRTAYAHRVFATLARGGQFAGRDGETISLPAHALPPALTVTFSPTLHSLADAQFGSAEWIPTSCKDKCDPTRSGETVQFVVIHDTEGPWNASVATLQNDPKKSVHYIVDTDGRIGQFVTEETQAWHSGNSVYNSRSIGIEHVGYAARPYSSAQYAASAKLVDYLTQKYSIPKDRAHIIGHDQVPDGGRLAEKSPPCALSPKACSATGNYGGLSNHSDPGSLWEWAGYMERFDGSAKCSDVTPIWNCSNDNSERFRCEANRVVVETCESPCMASPSGVDDFCSSSPNVIPGVTVDASTSIDAASGSNDAALDDESSGCSVSRRRRTRTSSHMPLIVFSFALAAAAYTSRRRKA